MPFVSASIHQKAMLLALREGLDASLLAHHNDREEVKGNKAYLPIEHLFEVYEAADLHLNPCFAIRQGKQLESDDYGTVGLSWRTCWRAREVLDRLGRFMVLVTDHGSASITESGGKTTLSIHRDAFRRGVEMANETTFVMLTGILHEITGKAIVPTKVEFKHASAHAAEFESFFRCPVVFNAPENRLHFNTADIDIPTLKADKTLNAYLVERLEEERKGILVNADRLLGEIRQLIKEALPSGIPSIIQVAEYHAMSARTLKRRLAEKDLSFRQVTHEIQQEVAFDLLRNTQQTIAEIAFQTGFSEQSAFNRAFKRWTGISPAEYRKSH